MPDGQHPSAEMRGVFGRPFAEQVAFFRGKLGNLVPTARWDDLIAAEHDTAFMVAGAAKADLLADLAAAVDKAITEGRGIDEFRQDFRAIVARNGWTGWTGEGSVKGEAWRVGVILRTNAYTSYAAGRFAQLSEGKFKWWVYRHGGSLEPRIQHLGWNGLMLDPGHEFWTTHYPPSDWGCSCYVVGARTMAGAKAMGGDPAKTLPADWRRRDPKTGAPIGIGRGWNYAPGASVAGRVSAMAWKLGSWDYSIAKAFMETVPAETRDALAASYRALPSTMDDAKAFARLAWEGAESKPARTLGQLSSRQAEAVARERGIDASGFDFSLSADEIRHVRDEHGDDAVERRRGQRGVMPADFIHLPRIVDQGLPRFVGLSRRHNAPTFEILGEVDGETFVTRWEYRAKRRTLTLLSLSIKTGVRS